MCGACAERMHLICWEAVLDEMQNLWRCVPPPPMKLTVYFHVKRNWRVIGILDHKVPRRGLVGRKVWRNIGNGHDLGHSFLLPKERKPEP